MNSPFDDLLKDLDGSDAPQGSSPQGREDPRRAEVLEGLMTASKTLAAIAARLDPTPDTHPLHGMALPQEARQELKALVDKLLAIQDRLEALERAAEQMEHPQPGQEIREQPLEHEDPWTPPARTEPQEEPAAPIVEPAPVAPASPPAKTEAELALERERADFETYKQQWEAAFAADPTLRAQHPEVEAYYQQIQTYFAEKEAFVASS